MLNFISKETVVKNSHKLKSEIWGQEGIPSRGPLPKASQPNKTKFKCPVKNCSSFMRGDVISEHFQENFNLFVLDKAVENYLQLRKIAPNRD